MDQVVRWPPDTPGLDEFKAAYGGRVFATLEGVYAWRWEWEKKFPNATYLIAPEDLDPETAMGLPPSPFQSIIWFENAYRATDLILYNCIRLIATRSLEISGIHIDVPLSETNSSDPLMPMQGTRHDVALEMCRMMNYHLHSLRRSSGAFMLLFPLNVAYLHLEDDCEGARSWLEKVMAVVADTHGFEIGRKENLPRQVKVVRSLETPTHWGCFQSMQQLTKDKTTARSVSKGSIFRLTVSMTLRVTELITLVTRIPVIITGKTLLVSRDDNPQHLLHILSRLIQPLLSPPLMLSTLLLSL